MYEGHWALEVIWTVVPLLITMVIFLWGARLYVVNAHAPADAMEISVVARQWMWKIQHPNGRREINELHVPVGQAVRLTLATEDVIHSFYVPAFRVKQDVVPGRVEEMWFQPTRAGTYHLFCAEYCGTQHSGMIGHVVVMEPHDFELWLGGNSVGETPIQAGQKLFVQFNCADCHAKGEGQRGPALRGLYGTQVSLADGRQVAADETYIRESILTPDAKVVAGFMPIMPSYRDQLTEQQILQLIAYIRSLTAASGEVRR
jgi:cytochrome c oxidase subunit 2